MASITDDVLNSEERADEFLLMGLRLAEGIDPERYAALSGRTLDPGRIATAARGRRDHRSMPTAGCASPRSGFPVLDAVVADLAA